MTKVWTFEKSPVRMIIVLGARFATTKPPFVSRPTPKKKCLNLGNGLIVFSSTSSTLKHTSTRSYYDIYRSLPELLVPTFRIFEDCRGFWMGTCNIYLGCPTKNKRDFTVKIFSSKHQKSVTVVPRGIVFQVGPPWQNFRKLSSFSVHGRI